MRVRSVCDARAAMPIGLWSHHSASRWLPVGPRSNTSLSFRVVACRIMTTSDTAFPSATGMIGLADEPAAVEIISSSILKLWGAVNDLTRLRPTRRERFRVTIFGSARVPPDHWVYRAVHDLAAELTRLDC